VCSSVLLALVVMETASERQSCFSSWGLRKEQLRQSSPFKSFAVWVVLGSINGGRGCWDSLLKAEGAQSWWSHSFCDVGASGLRGSVHRLPFPLGPSPNFPLSMTASGGWFLSRPSDLEIWNVLRYDLLNPSFAQLDAYCLLFTIKC
jgi:hypothetical protein